MQAATPPVARTKRTTQVRSMLRSTGSLNELVYIELVVHVLSTTNVYITQVLNKTDMSHTQLVLR